MKKSLLILLLIVQSLILQSQTVHWQKLYGGTDSDKATCFLSPSPVIYPSPGLIIGGYYKSVDGDFTSNQGNYDATVMSINPNNGDILWQTTFGGSNADYIYDIAFVGSDIYVVGTTKSNDGDITSAHGNYDYLVAKLDISGNLIWVKTFGGSDIDKATSVVIINSTIKVLGYSKSTDGDIATGSNHGGYDIWLLNLDTDGNILSQHTYGGSNDDKSVEFNKSWNFNDGIITGYSKSNDGDLTTNHGNYDYWIFKIDANDDIVWQQSYGGSGIDKDPHITNFSGMTYIAGTSNSTDGDITTPLGNFDIWFLEIDNQTGQLNFQTNIGGTGADFATDIIDTPMVTRSSNAPIGYIAGYSNSNDGDFTTNNGNYDSWLIGIDFSNNFNTFFHLGGGDVDELEAIDFNYLLGKTKSEDGSFNTQHGNYDIWLTNEELPFDNGGIEQHIINVKTYPNPVFGDLQIEVPNIQKIELFDINGQLVKSYKVPESTDMAKINLSNLPNGTYLLKTTTKKGVGLNKITKK